MKDPLVRFGVALESSLLRDLDAVVRARGGTRSELFRDLARAEVGRAKVPKAVDAIATLTMVYDHHARDLTERLTEATLSHFSRGERKLVKSMLQILADESAFLDPPPSELPADSPPGGACFSLSARKASQASGYRARISCRVRPSQRP